MSDGGDREFVYDGSRFYSRITPDAMGVWELRDVIDEKVTAAPQDARRRVRFEPADGAKVSDDGRTWQERAIAAEMANAQLRTELKTAQQRANLAESDERGRMAAMRAARESDRAAWSALQAELLTLAEQVAALYGREVELGRVTVRCDGEHENHPDGPDHAYDPELCHPRSATVEELIAFITGTLALDHPAVRFPQPGPATIASACAVARFELAREGGTLDKVAEAILRMAAEPQQPPRAELREMVTWADAPAGTVCGLCGHQRGEHVSPLGGDCEGTRVLPDMTRRVCGCRGLTIPVD